MIRDTLAANARNVFLCTYDGINLNLSRRSSTGGTTSASAGFSGVVPQWFKLVRQANQFTAYLSPDGTNWTKLGSTVSVTMAVNVYGGLAVTSANDGNVTTASFDNVSVTSSAPEYSLSASPNTLSVVAGAAASSTVSLTMAAGYTSVVSFGTTNLPVGITAAFSPASLSATGATSLTINSSGAASAGTYTIGITGTSGSLLQSTPLVLTISDGFSLSNSGTVTITAGNGGTATVNLAVTSGFSENVAFSLSGLPSGVTATFTPTSLTGSGSTSIGFTVPASGPGGTYPITVTGTGSSSGLIRTTTFNLVVKNFSLSASPSSITATHGGSGVTSTITLTMAGGFNSSVSFSVPTKPSGVTVSFSPTSRSSTGTSTMTVTASGSATPGNYTLTVKGANGALIQTTPVTLTVN